MRILLTGGYGLVGGRVAQHLQQAGHQVVLGTRRLTGQAEWLPQAEVVTTNWNDVNGLAKICKGVDVVIHAAGMNSQDCAADPVTAFEVNGLSTARLVDASTLAGVKRIIYFSTAHVYGNPLSGVITEDTSPSNLHPYATSHLMGEYAVLGANQRREIEGIVLRLSNAFGAPVHADVNCWMLLVNDLCRQAVLTGKLRLRTHGLQQRNFITLKETTRCVEHFINLPKEICSDGLFNLGGDRVVSVYELTQLVALRCQTILGFSPEILRIEPKPYEQVSNLEYNIGKLMASGFVLENPIEDEIDAALSFCQKTLK
jgi:UDP-glucose 4-epimerase